MQSEAPRDGRALRDVAKLAGPASRGGPQIPNADSSGLVDLGALMAAQPNWLDDALARAKSSARARTEDSVSQISLAPTARETTPEETQAAGVPRRRLLPLVLGVTGGAALLLAVAGVLVLRGHAAPVASAPKAVAVAAHVDEPIPPPPVADVAAPAAPPPVAAAPLPAPEKEVPAPRRGKHGARDASRASASVAKAASARAVAAPRAAAAAAAPTPPTSALESALRAAAGPTAPAPAPAPAADATPAPKTAASPAGGDGRPDRPSGSAVTSALTQVLPAARACLASGADPARATISFRPDGAVQKVDVTGGDAKSTSCIRSAFGRAKVPPFAQSTYTASVNVRAR